MEQTKYDVFISYSRRDYVDDLGNVLPDNMLSKIMELFSANGISYWFDEEGIYSGDEFASILTKAIRNSSLFLFVSSANSNQSKWTSNEISTALEFKKTIIPFRLDDSQYNDSVMMKIVSFDYIECRNQEKALLKLLKAVNYHLKRPSHGIASKANGVAENGAEAKRKENSYVAEEAKNVREQVAEDNNTPTHQDAKSNGIVQLVKNRKVLWSAISLVFLLVIGGGLIVLCNEGNTTPTTQDVAVGCHPVDLGLPSGTMWADRNVGAAKKTDFGNLYSWGEVKIKKDYSMSTYVEQLKPLRTITQAKHDVAKAELGGEWSMPTEEQFNELLTECKWYWKKVNGHNGYEIVGKNGNSIFLPASGWNRGTAIEYQNQYGYYWTSERSSNPRFARSLQFPKDGKGIVGNGELHVGRSVRAIYVIN